MNLEGIAARLPGRRGPGRASAGPRGDSGFWSDARVELLLGAIASIVLALIGGMIIFVFSKAWPSFAHNGLAWFGSGGDVDLQLEDIFNSPANPSEYVYTLHAWPLLWGTFVVTALARSRSGSSSRCSPRSSSSSSRRRRSTGCWSRWCGCWPRSPRSSTG